VFAVGVLVLATGSFFPLFGGGGSEDGTPLARLIWAVVYVLAAIGLLDGALRQRMRVRLPVPLLLYVSLAAVSVTWSVGPGLSLRRSIGLAGTILVGMYLAQRLRPLELLDALRQALLIVAVCSLALYLSGSALALDEVHGTLRGVLPTKNTLGRFMALGLLAASTTALLDRERTRRCALSALPMVVALSLTDSTGGTIVAAIVLVCLAGAVLWRDRAGQVLLLAAVSLALSALVVLLPNASASSVTGLVGEDATLTGRTDIWGAVVQTIGERPLLGHGYGAFWRFADAARQIQARLNWDVPTAHNGLLDVGLSLGLPGMLLAAFVLANLAWHGVRDARSGFAEGAFLRLPIAGLLIVSTIVESGLLTQNLLLTVMLVAALAAPHRRQLTWVDQTLQPRPGPRAAEATTPPAGGMSLPRTTRAPGPPRSPRPR